MIKVNLKNIFGLAALGMTLLSGTIPTWAGSVDHAEVFIGKLKGGYSDAGGTMAGARYSRGYQFIGCDLYAASNTAPLVYCYARDSRAVVISCSSTDPAYVEQTQRMTDSSFIYFKSNSAGACSQLHIANGSPFLP